MKSSEAVALLERFRDSLVKDHKKTSDISDEYILDFLKQFKKKSSLGVEPSPPPPPPPEPKQCAVCLDSQSVELPGFICSHSGEFCVECVEHIIGQECFGSCPLCRESIVLVERYLCFVGNEDLYSDPETTAWIRWKSYCQSKGIPDGVDRDAPIDRCVRSVAAARERKRVRDTNRRINESDSALVARLREEYGDISDEFLEELLYQQGHTE